jgi:tetratricopeptide (TPR) repeat protein
MSDLKIDFREAIELDPDAAVVYHNRGSAYSDKKDYDRAIADYTQAIELDPNGAVIYNNRGLAYSCKKDYDRTIADCTRAIELDPDAAVVYHNRGNAYSNKKDYDRAIADYTQAIELDPNYARAYKVRGWAYKKKGNKAQAQKDDNRAVELDPSLKESGCFITSAVCTSFAKPDDCYELSQFRQFRDGWLTQQPDGPALIERYYRTAPAIVAAIDHSPQRDAVYRGIWDAHLAPCLLAIENDRLEDCKRRYISMVETLGAEYL